MYASLGTLVNGRYDVYKHILEAVQPLKDIQVVRLCNSKPQSVRNETEQYNALHVKLFRRPSRKMISWGLLVPE